MVEQSTPTDTRAEILRAANTLVRDRGPARLTLAEVARIAGVSKGGLLYHFVTKDALIVGMLEQALERFDKDVESRAALQGAEKGGWLGAFVEVTFEAQPEHDLSMSILAAAAVNPELLSPVSAYFERWKDRAVRDGCDPTVATIVRLAADGLWFADMFTTSAPQGTDRDALKSALQDMVAVGSKEGVAG